MSGACTNARLVTESADFNRKMRMSRRALITTPSWRPTNVLHSRSVWWMNQRDVPCVSVGGFGRGDSTASSFGKEEVQRADAADRRHVRRECGPMAPHPRSGEAAQCDCGFSRRQAARVRSITGPARSGTNDRRSWSRSRSHRLPTTSLALPG